jgi:diaminopimelate epimerase
MKLAFCKMHGAGNDFVVIDLIRQNVSLTPGQIRWLADRHRGVGCDQVLLVEPPDHADADFAYRIFNSDGTPAGQCGNGARCFARFVREQQLTYKDRLVVQVAGGLMHLEIAEDGRIFANLGAPIVTPSKIPFNRDCEAIDYPLQVGDTELTIGALSMGNPHAVTIVDDIHRAPVATLGPMIEAHPDFPERVNAGFMQIHSPKEIALRVYERGAGETLACGTGACAAVVYGIRKGLLDNVVTVQLPGGKLSVRWAGESEPVWLGGPTATVFEGVVKLRRR